MIYDFDSDDFYEYEQLSEMGDEELKAVLAQKSAMLGGNYKKRMQVDRNFFRDLDKLDRFFQAENHNIRQEYRNDINAIDKTEHRIKEEMDMINDILEARKEWRRNLMAPQSDINSSSQTSDPES